MPVVIINKRYTEPRQKKGREEVGAGYVGGGGEGEGPGGGVPQRLTVTLQGRHCRTQHSKCSPKDTERHPVEKVF